MDFFEIEVFYKPVILIFIFFEDKDGFWHQVNQRTGGADFVGISFDKRASTVSSGFCNAKFSNKSLMVYKYETLYHDSNVKLKIAEIEEFVTIALEELKELFGKFHAVMTYNELFEVNFSSPASTIFGLFKPENNIEFEWILEKRKNKEWESKILEFNKELFDCGFKILNE